MKNLKSTFLTSCFLLAATITFAQIAIGTTSPDISAVLDVTSTTKGMLVPRMNSTQREEISNPAVGLLVFDETTGSFWFYNGIWANINSSSPNIPIAISDADNNTKIQVEETNDDNIIRFDTEGTEFFRMDNGHFEVMNTGGSVFIGEGAGANDDLKDNYNVFIGDSAGYSNTEGINNTANGFQALFTNSTGYDNTANGYDALYSNTTGHNNTANGA
ncbi:MAG: hypothetical protein GY787_22155, partial [Alteromonadales bacterium]|nr:hypothetical protein [Alteromonadales bacterium]